MKSFIRRLNVLFIIFLSTIFLIGCCSKIKLKNNYKQIYPESKIPFKTSNYAFVEMEITSIDGNLIPQNILSWTGTGSIVKHKEGKSYILTAGHVCKETVTPQMIEVFGNKELDEHSYEISVLIHDFSKRKFVGKVHAISKDRDLCLIEIPKQVGSPIKITERVPKIGEEVWTISSPLGLGVHNSAPVLSGHYSGKDRNGDYMVTIPSAPGA